MSEIKQQLEFMKAFDMVSPSVPTLDTTVMALWASLIEEELDEMIEAMSEFQEEPNDIENQANLTAEICDVLYVVMGFGHSLGLPIAAMFSEIHAANMRKVRADGTVIRNDSGKVMKPTGWFPADKVGVLITQKHLTLW